MTLLLGLVRGFASNVAGREWTDSGLRAGGSSSLSPPPPVGEAGGGGDARRLQGRELERGGGGDGRRSLGQPLGREPERGSEDDGRGLHSSTFQLNLSGSNHH
jgi:hypothetical protein